MVAAFEAEEIHLNDRDHAGIRRDRSIAIGTLVRQEKTTAQHHRRAHARRMNAPYDGPARAQRHPARCRQFRSCSTIGINGLGNRQPRTTMSAQCIPNTPNCRRSSADPARRDGADDRGRPRRDGDRADLDRRRLATRRAQTPSAGSFASAGFNLKRTVLPGSTFWNDWTKYPFSTTNWGHRPLGVQVLGLAYKSGEAWNESGHANTEFDEKLAQAVGIFDAEERRAVMADIQAILQSSGVIIQPFWGNQYLHHLASVKNYERHQFREMHLEEVWLDE